MNKLEYTLRFNTPAFLGNAEQSGQWRTPPIKALLRQWWRVVKAKEYGYKHADIRQHEGDLFGDAWLKDAHNKPLHRKSRVALRLTLWHDGKLTSQGWPGGAMESVTTRRDGKGRVRGDVYFGFSPVLPPSKKENRPSVTIRGAIGTDEKENVVLELLPERLPKLKPSDEDMKDICDAIQLITWFGTVGSRSRNVWGAVAFSAERDTHAVSHLPKEADALLARDGRTHRAAPAGTQWPGRGGGWRGGSSAVRRIPAPGRRRPRRGDLRHARPGLAPPLEAIRQTGRFKLTLTAPGLFAQGWRPTLPEGLAAQLVCAATPRFEVISGWDLAAWAPKDAERAVPAGAVYWFEDFAGDPGKLAEWAAGGLWVHDSDRVRRAEGFNNALFAAWPQH